MKAEHFILISEQVRANAILRINELPMEGKIKVTISDSGGKTARQRGLQFMWYTEVSEAGIGGRHEDTKEGVHLAKKSSSRIKIGIAHRHLLTRWTPSFVSSCLPPIPDSETSVYHIN